MLDRVVDLSASNQLLGYVTDTRRRVNDLQAQVSSGYVSQTYSGIARDAGRLVGLETVRDHSQRLLRNNEMMDLRLKTSETTLSSVRTTIEQFRSMLLDYSKGNTDDAGRVALVQDAALKSLDNLQGLLNTEIDGRYLYAGSRVTTRPVELDLSSLDNFQTLYDGEGVTFTTARAGQLAQVSLTQGDTGSLAFDRAAGTITAATAGAFANIPAGGTIRIAGSGANDGVYTVTANTGTVVTVRSIRLAASETAPAAVLTAPGDIRLGAADTGDLAFDAAAGTITAANAGALATIPVGSAITVSGSPSNDGTYTVAGNDGTTLTIAVRRLTDATVAGGTTIATGDFAYYRGDERAAIHRLDRQRSVSVDVTAADPVFEKAIRAMGIIAQGRFGSAGGLDQNADRIDQALFLLNSALERTPEGTPPFGPEAAGNIEDLGMRIGYQRVLIAATNDRLKSVIAALDGEAATVEIADNTDAVTRLVNQANALEQSFAAISRILKLNLAQYL